MTTESELTLNRIVSTGRIEQNCIVLPIELHCAVNCVLSNIVQNLVYVTGHMYASTESWMEMDDMFLMAINLQEDLNVNTIISQNGNKIVLLISRYRFYKLMIVHVGMGTCPCSWTSKFCCQYFAHLVTDKSMQLNVAFNKELDIIYVSFTFFMEEFHFFKTLWWVLITGIYVLSNSHVSHVLLFTHMKNMSM